MATRKKKGAGGGSRRRRGTKSERKEGASFETSQQVSESGKSEGNEARELEKGEEELHGTDELSSKSGRMEEEESESEAREGPFGGNIPPRAEGDVGYGRHAGQSGAM